MNNVTLSSITRLHDLRLVHRSLRYLKGPWLVLANLTNQNRALHYRHVQVQHPIYRACIAYIVYSQYHTIFERNSHNDIAENERKFKIAQKKAVPLLFSARQHICYSALYAIARPSVRPSVRHTGGSVKDV